MRLACYLAKATFLFVIRANLFRFIFFLLVVIVDEDVGGCDRELVVVRVALGCQHSVSIVGQQLKQSSCYQIDRASLNTDQRVVVVVNIFKDVLPVKSNNPEAQANKRNKHIKQDNEE